MDIELIAFDLDGTLIEFNLPFDRIRKEIGIKKRFILESIMEMDGERKKRALEVLKRYEIESAKEARPMYFASELLEALEREGILKGVVTRNSRESVKIVSERFGFKFDFVITREDTEPKPSPKPIILALKMFDIKPRRALTVGDFLFDLMAGKKAGTKTALILTPKNKEMTREFYTYADYVFKSLKELAKFVGVV